MLLGSECLIISFKIGHNPDNLNEINLLLLLVVDISLGDVFFHDLCKNILFTISFFHISLAYIKNVQYI